NSTFSSLLRFGYYYIDYLIGQFIIQFKYVLRGYIVLYDRYYFDFINDGKRSNICLPPAFVKLWYIFLLKPKFNFFLYADEQTILNRKKELDKKTIGTLTANYLKLFSQLGKRSNTAKYIAIENIQLLNTLRTIDHNLKQAVL